MRYLYFQATLADCLRRLNSLEVDRGHVEVVTTPSATPIPGVGPNINGFSKIPQRRPMSATAARELRGRRISDTAAARPGSGAGRRAGQQLHLSNTSLNSEGGAATPLNTHSNMSSR